MELPAIILRIVRPRDRAAPTGLNRLSWKCIFAFFALSACLVRGAFGNDSIETLEYKVKAGYLVNFAKFIEWPPSAFPTAGHPIVIGVMSTVDILETIKAVVAGKTVHGRPLEVRPIQALDAAVGCHIFFATRSAKPSPTEIAAEIGSRPILIVGETDNFAESGGTIAFMHKDESLRLSLNLDALNAAGLKASAKLASVAKIVKRKRG